MRVAITNVDMSIGKIKDWNSQLCMLSTVAEIQLQAPYSAFANSVKNKLSNFMITIPDMNNLLLPIENIIRNRFIPAMTSGCMCNEKEQYVSCYLCQLDMED